MADIKISELGAALTVGDSDVLPMTASGVTSKVSTSLLKDYVIGTTDISAIGDGTVTGAIDAINTDMPDGLDDLDDVSITTPADGEAPVYDSVSQKFKNTAIVTQDEFGDVIAPIEVSPSAHAYSVGKQLLYNNVLYTVTSPIAVSDALTEGTNITASDAVMEQIKDNAEGIEELNDAWKVNGVYNILPNNATTQVTGEVTWTVNSNGTVSATVASTTSQNRSITIYSGTALNVSGLKAVGTPTTEDAKMTVTYSDNTTADETGNGLTLGSNVKTVILTVKSGTTAQTIAFKPMITTDLNATYNDYQPYAKTNRELTEIKTITGISATSTAYSLEYASVKRVGNIVQVFFSVKITSNVSAGGNADGTLSGLPLPFMNCQGDTYTGTKTVGWLIQPDGTLRIRAVDALVANEYVAMAATYICN